MISCKVNLCGNTISNQSFFNLRSGPIEHRSHALLCRRSLQLGLYFSSSPHITKMEPDRRLEFLPNHYKLRTKALLSRFWTLLHKKELKAFLLIVMFIHVIFTLSLASRLPMPPPRNMGLDSMESTTKPSLMITEAVIPQ